MGLHTSLNKMRRDQEEALLVTFRNRLKEMVDEESVWVADMAEIIQSIVDEMIPGHKLPLASMWLAWDCPDPAQYDIELEFQALMTKRMRVGLFFAYEGYLSCYVQSAFQNCHEETLQAVEEMLVTLDLDGPVTVHENGAKQFGVTRA